MATMTLSFTEAPIRVQKQLLEAHLDTILDQGVFQGISGHEQQYLRVCALCTSACMLHPPPWHAQPTPALQGPPSFLNANPCCSSIITPPPRLQHSHGRAPNRGPQAMLFPVRASAGLTPTPTASTALSLCSLLMSNTKTSSNPNHNRHL